MAEHFLLEGSQYAEIINPQQLGTQAAHQA